MAVWDLGPASQPDTGLPASFMEMPIPDHIELWARAPDRLLRQSRYAALLISMHGVRLYEIRDLDTLPAPRGRSYSTSSAASAVPGRPGRHAESGSGDRGCGDAGLIARNSQLIWTWDYVSLALCLDSAPYAVKGVTAADQQVALAVSSPGDEGA